MSQDDAITFDGLDEAIIGFGSQWSRRPVAVYSEARIIDALVKQGMDEVEAWEWYAHNIACLWCGEQTPLIIQDT
tara:strand:- start:638 stop:862 length:225 start_codon:yes stop_codon:yes gene_type:complete